MPKPKTVRPGWPAPVQEMIRQALGPNGGLTMAELMAATGREKGRLAQQMSYMLSTGKLFAIIVRPRWRYYPTAEAMERDRPVVLEREAALRAETRRRAIQRATAARAAKEAERRALLPEKRGPGRPKKAETMPAPPKPKKPPKPPVKPPWNSMSEIDARRPALPVDRKAPPVVVWPEHVTVQRAPAPRDERFWVDPATHVGDLRAEWLAKRAGGAA